MHGLPSLKISSSSFRNQFSHYQLSISFRLLTNLFTTSLLHFLLCQYQFVS